MTDTVQQLHELPDLAAECFATWGHPNPSERPVVAVKRIHPKAPADLDTLDALDCHDRAFAGVGVAPGEVHFGGQVG